MGVIVLAWVFTGIFVALTLATTWVQIIKAGLLLGGATLGLGLLAVLPGILFKGQNVAFMAGLAFAVAAGANFPSLVLAISWKRQPDVPFSAPESRAVFHGGGVSGGF